MRLVLTIAFACLLFAASAQVQRCHTDEYVEELKSKDPGLALRMEQARLQADLVRNYQSAQKSTNDAIITIPVVVHVMYTTDTNSQISDAQILSQIKVLNEDYQAQNRDLSHVPAHFANVVGNPNLQFCLAKLDPDGNPTSGIDRVDMGTNSWNNSWKPGTIWDNARYLNIWVAQVNGGVLGYATYPGTDSTADGVVIDYRYFGRAPANPFHNDFNLGRTATHEIGHWLGLYHTFEGYPCDGNTATNCATEGDRICDTPPTASANYNCSFPITRNTCTETPNDLPDMWMNYLDYMDDACLYMFTQGQVDEMRAVLNTSRSTILTSFACDAQDLFSFSGQVVDAHTGQGIAGAKVLFTGSAKYELETDANGNFNTPDFRRGTYSIYAGKWGYLTNEFSTDLSIDTGTASIAIPVQSGRAYDDFLFDFGWGTSGSAISGMWEYGFPVETEYEDDSNDVYISNPGIDAPNDFGDYCYVTGNEDGLPGNNDVDDGNVVLTSPVFDLTGYSEPYLSYYRWFFNAGQGSPNDALTITLSNGTQTVTLETIDASQSGSQWVFSNFRVKDFISPTSTMQFSVETSDEAGTGHLVEAGIDVFQVVDSMADNVGIIQTDAEKLFIYPNPAHTLLNIAFDSPAGSFSVLFFDVSGKVLRDERFPGAERAVQVDVRDLPAGFYVIKIVNNGKTYLRKATVMH